MVGAPTVALFDIEPNSEKSSVINEATKAQRTVKAG